MPIDDYSIKSNLVRMWAGIYDISTGYKVLNDERNTMFDQYGVKDHYFASTGVGAQKDHLSLYSVMGLDPAQVEYLSADGLMPAPKDYGVLFERGIKVNWYDRANLYISGTASINFDGKVMYERDVVAQTERALRNMAGVLRSGNAVLSDLEYLVVYVRDAADFNIVRAVLDRALIKAPIAYVQAEICRPEWLVEIEGVATIRQDEPRFPEF